MFNRVHVKTVQLRQQAVYLVLFFKKAQLQDNWKHAPNDLQLNYNSHDKYFISKKLNSHDLPNLMFNRVHVKTVQHRKPAVYLVLFFKKAQLQDNG